MRSKFDARGGGGDAGGCGGTVRVGDGAGGAVRGGGGAVCGGRHVVGGSVLQGVCEGGLVTNHDSGHGGRYC
jgi:hypothetical protein